MKYLKKTKADWEGGAEEAPTDGDYLPLCQNTCLLHAHLSASIFLRTIIDIIHYPATFPNHPNSPPHLNLNPIRTPTLNHCPNPRAGHWSCEDRPKCPWNKNPLAVRLSSTFIKLQESIMEVETPERGALEWLLSLRLRFPDGSDIKVAVGVCSRWLVLISLSGTKLQEGCKCTIYFTLLVWSTLTTTIRLMSDHHR